MLNRLTVWILRSNLFLLTVKNRTIKLRGIILALYLGSMVMLPLAAQVTVGGFLNLNIAGINVKPGGTGEDYSSYLGFGLGGVVTYPLSGGLLALPMITGVGKP